MFAVSMYSYWNVLLNLVALFVCVHGIPQTAAKPSSGDLNIPRSSSTVNVRIIDTTSFIYGLPLTLFVQPQIKGFTTLSAPAYSFLVEHPSGRKVLFDLGVRTDPHNLAPSMANTIVAQNWTVTAQKGVRQILEEGNVQAKDIEGIIWSHTHFDHTGDPSTFPNTTSLIVGANFTSTFIPGYPANPSSTILESDYAGRQIREIAFTQNLRIGNFKAHDYFGDGSFYLLDTPGHAVAHLCGLARVTTKPSTYIFMGADAAHHNGEFRPSRYRSIPSKIKPNPFDPTSTKSCPGEIFDQLYRDGDPRKPFYGIATLGTENGVQYNLKEAERTIDKVVEFDASDEIFVIMAHDDSILGIVDFFPKYINAFKKLGWAETSRWRFVKDFLNAVRTAAGSS